MSQRQIEHQLGLSSDSVSYILEFLVKDRYLTKESRGAYSFLPKGVDVLVNRLYDIMNRLRKELARRQMDIEEIEHKIDSIVEQKNKLVSKRV